MPEFDYNLYVEAAEARKNRLPARAIEIYADLAKQGDTFSMVALGRMHATGEGVAVDLSKAEELLSHAAALGSAEAVLQLASLRQESGDMNRYFVDLQEATSRGSMVAQHLLGLCYAYGRGTAVDMPKALEFIRAAAKRGFMRSRYFLARRLISRPYNPFGLIYGLIKLPITVAHAVAIALKDPHDERVR